MVRETSWVLKGCVATLALVAMANGASGQPLQKISIGLSSISIAASSARVAKELGLFEKRGLDATITPMENGNVASASVMSGSTNFAATGPTDVVVTNARGQDLVALCSLYSGYSGVLVLAKSVVDKLGVSPSAPLAQRAKALDGLVIASPSATSTYTLAPKPLAEANGATIRFTYMSQPAMSAALETGAIQGFVSGAPFYAPSVVKEKSVIWISGPKGEFPVANTPANAIVLVGTRAYATANRDVAKRTCAVFDDLGKAIKERPEEVKQAMVRAYPDLDRPTIDSVFQTESVALATRPLTKEDMAREVSFLKASGANVNVDGVDPANLMFIP